MFTQDKFEFRDSNEGFSDMSGMESFYNADASTSTTEFSRRKRLMTKENIEKRKQQNRTAQKAFRERKERHLRDIETQLSYKQHQIQAICGQNRYLEDRCQFLSNQYEILEKKFQEAQSRLKTFEELTKNPVTGRYEPIHGILGAFGLEGSIEQSPSLNRN